MRLSGGELRSTPPQHVKNGKSGATCGPWRGSPPRPPHWTLLVRGPLLAASLCSRTANMCTSTAPCLIAIALQPVAGLTAARWYSGDLKQEEKDMMEGFMRQVSSAAATSRADVKNAALIVNTDTHDVVALELDAQSSHPLHHAVMQALDAVANGYLAQSRALDGGGAAEPQTKLTRRTDDEHVAAAGARNKAQTIECSPYDEPYLCKGYDCYVLHEPCVMCAMALTHSRIRRVLFSKKDPIGGALGGAFRLHGKGALNHRLMVYHVHLPEH